MLIVEASSSTHAVHFSSSSSLHTIHTVGAHIVIRDQDYLKTDNDNWSIILLRLKHAGKHSCGLARELKIPIHHATITASNDKDHVDLIIKALQFYNAVI